MRSPSVDDLVRVHVVADRQLPGRDHAFGLEADVEKDLVLVDLDDGARDDVAVVELDDGAGDGILERGAVEVVSHHLARRVLTCLVEGAHLRLGRRPLGAAGVGRCGVVVVVSDMESSPSFRAKSTPRKRSWGEEQQTVRRKLMLHLGRQQKLRVFEVGRAPAYAPGRTAHSPVTRRPAASAISRNSRGVKHVVHRSKVADCALRVLRPRLARG